VTPYAPMRDLQDGGRDERTLRLLVDGKPRFGKWSNERECWVSTVEPRLRLRPAGWAEMPIAPNPPPG